MNGEVHDPEVEAEVEEDVFQPQPPPVHMYEDPQELIQQLKSQHEEVVEDNDDVFQNYESPPPPSPQGDVTPPEEPELEPEPEMNEYLHRHQEIGDVDQFFNRRPESDLLEQGVGQHYQKDPSPELEEFGQMEAEVPAEEDEFVNSHQPEIPVQQTGEIDQTDDVFQRPEDFATEQEELLPEEEEEDIPVPVFNPVSVPAEIEVTCEPPVTEQDDSLPEAPPPPPLPPQISIDIDPYQEKELRQHQDEVILQLKKRQGYEPEPAPVVAAEEEISPQEEEHSGAGSPGGLVEDNDMEVVQVDVIQATEVTSVEMAPKEQNGGAVKDVEKGKH